MPSSKPSGLARFTRQGVAPKPGDAGPPPGGGAETSPSSRPAAVPPSTDPAPAGSAGGRDAGKAKLVGVYLMPDGHRQLKIEAAKRGATVSDLVREALNAWFTNEHLPPLA